MVNHERCFWNVFIGMLGFMNDSHILWLSSLHLKATYGGLFNFGLHGSQDIIHSYILGGKGYSLLLWFMIPHKQTTNVKHTLWMPSSTNTFQRGRMLWKMSLGFWRRHLKNYYSKTTFTLFSLLILLHVLTSFSRSKHTC